jgi:hypothetical protein
MNTIDTRRYEMLVRVRGFGDEYKDLFPESSLAREQFGVVAAAVTQLGTHAVSKMSAAHEGRITKAMARKALNDRLEDFGRTARAITEDTPGLEDKFHRPEARTDQALITAARLFARDAAAFTTEFTVHAMPATFVADLNALADQFEEAIHAREAGKSDQTAARARIQAAWASASAALRKLDATVLNHLKDDPVTLAVWKRERRVGRPHRVRKAPAAQTTVPPVSAPSPSS